MDPTESVRKMCNIASESVQTVREMLSVMREGGSICTDMTCLMMHADEKDEEGDKERRSHDRRAK